MATSLITKERKVYCYSKTPRLKLITFSFNKKNENRLTSKAGRIVYKNANVFRDLLSIFLECMYMCFKTYMYKIFVTIHHVVSFSFSYTLNSGYNEHGGTIKMCSLYSLHKENDNLGSHFWFVKTSNNRVRFKRSFSYDFSG